MTVDHIFIETNGIRLHVAQAGPADGPLVILLHGFPEFWYGWRHQIDELAAAGYRVWAPDQRGYNQSDKPVGVGAYRIDQLAADVVGLIDAAGQERALLVGHDWGAAVAWWMAATQPQRLSKLVILNVPHPKVMRWYLRKHPRQLLKSWYIFFFQLPFLPEWFARANNWWFMSRMLLRSSHPGTFTPDDLTLYRQAWAQTGPTGASAFRTMVNWYRAGPRRATLGRAASGRAVEGQESAKSGSLRITVPTLIIWGVEDSFLSRGMAKPSLDLCDDGQLIFVEKATHWVQHEAAEWVNALLRGFFNRPAA